jgi:hypothetical protein
MSHRQQPDGGWLNFNIHGRMGVRVAADAPAAPQLRTMLACFLVDEPVPADLTVSRDPQPVAEAALLEDELRYTGDALEFVREGVQVLRNGDRFAIHGAGELLTSLVPVLDRAMVVRGAAMIHAATVGYAGGAIALAAGGSTGKTSTVAKLMRRPGFSFMGDDWAFLGDDKELLGYEKPMFIRPHHRPIYPHLFQGARKPMVPSSLSGPVGRLASVVHPYVIRYPRLAHFSRRWSPEHKMVMAADALPGVPVTRSAPLRIAVYVERHDGSTTNLTEQGATWMADRMMGNFHIEMAKFSQELVAAMAATSMLPWKELVEEKNDVLTKALDGIPCYRLQVPGKYTADQASDEVVRALEMLLEELSVNAVGER